MFLTSKVIFLTQHISKKSKNLFYHCLFRFYVIPLYIDIAYLLPPISICWYAYLFSNTLIFFNPPASPRPFHFKCASFFVHISKNRFLRISSLSTSKYTFAPIQQRIAEQFYNPAHGFFQYQLQC